MRRPFRKRGSHYSCSLFPVPWVLFLPLLCLGASDSNPFLICFSWHYMFAGYTVSINEREDDGMAREKLAALLCETIGATAEEAEAALEARDWDVLKAAELLQRQRRMKRVAAARGDAPRGPLCRLAALLRAPFSGKMR